MFRWFALLVLATGLGLQAGACDMRSSARSAELAGFVENGWSCLSAPGREFAFAPDMEREFIRLINAERHRHKLAPLALRPQMISAARFHSLDMGVNGFFGHRSPAGKTHARRIAAFDRTLLPRYTAENVAKSERVCTDRTGQRVRCNRHNRTLSGTVAELHQKLMNSPSHRANILSPVATHIAIGVAKRDGDLYVTQLFAEPLGELDKPLPIRLPAGSRVDVIPRMDDWTFRRFAMIQDLAPVDLQDGILPLGHTGDANLGVRCERLGEPVIEATRIIQPFDFMYLTGPAFSVSPPNRS